MQKLRKAGYGIDGARNTGYMLVSRPDLVTPEELKYYFKRNGVGGHSIFYFPVASSTQDEAKKIAGGDAALPAIVIAERQTGSYGRRRRQWSSPEGGLWFSLVLKPDMLPDKIPQITFAASLAVCRAVEIGLGLDPLIKWPNDVTLDGKKFAGILTEMSAEVGRLNWVVIGIGIDANNSVPPELKRTAVSLSEIAGHKICRAEFLAGVLSEFYGLYDVFLEKGFAGFEKEYNKRSLLAGAVVKVDTGDEVIEGKVQKIDADGYLWIKPAGKHPVKIIAGDMLSVKSQ